MSWVVVLELVFNVLNAGLNEKHFIFRIKIILSIKIKY